MGEFLAIGDRQVYPLSLSVAQEQARQGLAVVGNAAHTLHPIAGQGFNLALRGSFALAQAVLKACEQGTPMGDLTNLNQFVATSRWDQERVISASDKVMKLFSSKKPHYSALRQLGLFTMQQIPAVKTIFTRAAMGLDVPLSKVLAMVIRAYEHRQHCLRADSLRHSLSGILSDSYKHFGFPEGGSGCATRDLFHEFHA